MNPYDELELALRRLADDLTALRSVLVGIVDMLTSPPDTTPESRAA